MLMLLPISRKNSDGKRWRNEDEEEGQRSQMREFIKIIMRPPPSSPIQNTERTE